MYHSAAATDQMYPSAASQQSASGSGGIALTSLDSITRPIHVVIVAATPRTGSSFLGELVASPNQAMYLFEPVWHHDFHIKKVSKRNFYPDYNRRIVEDLASLMQCRFEKVPGMFDAGNQMEIWTKPKIYAPLTLQQRTSLCQDLPMRVIKLVRMSLHNILPMLKMRDLNVHVISLVRDPRGIVNSAGAFKAWSKFFSPRDTCNWLRNDLETYHDLTTLDHTTLDHATLDHETRRRILQVRYEDVVADPQYEAQRIFNWLGLKVPEEVGKFLELHTRQSRPSSTSTETSNATGSSSSPPTVSKEAATSIVDDVLPAGEVTNAPSAADVKSSKATNNAASNAASNATSATSTNATSTTTTEEETKTTLVPPGAFKDRYGTIREATFNGLEWTRDLDRNLRHETEVECKDVLEYLNYPLVYPHEEVPQTTTTTETPR